MTIMSRNARDAFAKIIREKIEELHEMAEVLALEFGDVDDELDAAIGHLLIAAKIMESDE